jgi:hypothetical protein
MTIKKLVTDYWFFFNSGQALSIQVNLKDVFHFFGWLEALNLANTKYRYIYVKK